MTYQQTTLEGIVETESIYDWVEYTGCRFCDALIVAKWPKRLFGERITCPKCGKDFVVCSAVLADREDFERSNLE
jgi:hypothetical protein